MNDLIIRQTKGGKIVMESEEVRDNSEVGEEKEKIIMALTAKYDEKGSLGTDTMHFTFGTMNSAVSGGVYVVKGKKVPDELHLIFVRKPEG